MSEKKGTYITKEKRPVGRPVGYREPIGQLAKMYAKQMENGAVLSNQAAIEIIDQRILQLAGRIDVEDAPQRMKHLYSLFVELKTAQSSGKGAEVIVLMKELDNEFEKAYHDYAAWEQMILVFDLRRKMVESEIKVVKEMKAILTAEQAYKLVAKLMAICIRLIKDPKLLRQINYEFSRLIGENDLREPVEIVDMEDEEEAEEDD
jgi:hypothetical protein